MTLAGSSFHDPWLVWATALMLPWALLFTAQPGLRRPMLSASALTAPLGLTEPLFVPAYWNPPTRFGQAQRTGFDRGSLVFGSAIGGLGVAGYRALAAVPLTVLEHRARSSPRHRWHLLALASPVLVFVALIALSWNPIHPAILAMGAGAAATVLCRPDLWRIALLGGGVFLGLYGAFLLWRKWLWPGDTRRCGTSAPCLHGGRQACHSRSSCSALHSASTGPVCAST